MSIGYARYRSPDPDSEGGGAATATGNGEYDYDDTLFDNDLQDQPPAESETPAESDDDSDARSENNTESDDVEVDGDEKKQEQSPSSRQEQSTQPDEDDESATDNGEAADQKFDSGLLERAGNLNFTYSDVQSLGTNGALEAAVRREEALHQRWQQQEAARQEQQRAAVGNEQKQEDSKEPEEPPFDDWIEKGYDKAQVEVMRQQWSANQATQQRLNSLESQGHQERQLQSQRDSVERENRFDGMVKTLGNEYSDLFGTQDRSTQMDRTSHEFQNRAMIFGQMNRLAAGYQATGEPMPIEQDLFDKALRSEFGTRQTELARREVKTKLKKAGKQAISRPGKTRPKPQTGEEDAAQFARDWFRDNGGDFQDSIESDDEI